jgi:hypothetical protein
MPYIPTEPVESSNIEAIGYHRQTQTLRIIFQGGRAYDYPMVLEQEYKKLMESESKGKFFNSRIKPMYAHRTPRPEELKEPCCVHPERDTCDESCFPCDEWCCPGPPDAQPTALQLLDRARALLFEHLNEKAPVAELEGVLNVLRARLEEIAEMATAPTPIKDACSEHPDECPDSCPGEDEEIEGEPTEDRDDLIDMSLRLISVCRCCAVPLKLPPEDAVDLCLACFRSKGGDTDEPCTFDHPDCPHGADDRTCGEGCLCLPCHGWDTTRVEAPGGVDPVDYQQPEPEPED